jgi:peptide/nickel transport system permease protein
MASHAGILALYTRAAVTESLAADFARTARTIGASEARVVWRHALPAAAVPIVTMAGLTLAHFLEGSLVVETVFAWPGVGQLTVASVARRDYPVLLALTLCAGVAVALATTVTDFVAAWLDPRVPRS